MTAMRHYTQLLLFAIAITPGYLRGQTAPDQQPSVPTAAEKESPSQKGEQKQTGELKLTPEQKARLSEAERLDDKRVDLYRQSKFAEATVFAKQVLAIREEILHGDHVETARSVNALAMLYQYQGNYAEALPLFQRALKIREKALGSEHPDTTLSLKNLAILYQLQGNYAEALPLFQRSLKIREKVLGQEHHDTAISLNSLAGLYHMQGNYAEALPLYQRALRIHEQALGPEHRETATCLNNLAILYHHQGNYAEALPLYQRALKINEKVRGQEHHDTVAGLNNLAGLYQSQGNYADALPLYRRALEIYEKALGPEHPYTAQSLHSLAVLYKDQGNYAEALPLDQRALKIREKVLGREHPDTAASLSNLAGLYYAQGNFAEALPLFQRSLKIREKVLGPEHPDTATGLHNLAGLYQSQGNYADALPLYQRALKITEKALGPEHPDTAASVNALAVLYQNQGNYVDAEQLGRRAIKISLQHLDLTAVIQSARQQLVMSHTISTYVDNYLSAARGAGTSEEQVYATVLAWKGSVSARQHFIHQMHSDQQDPNSIRLFNELADAARQFDSLSRAIPKPEQVPQYRQRLTDLHEKMETLQQKLSAAGADYRRAWEQARSMLADVRRALPADAILVDLLEYSHLIPPKEQGKQPIWERRLVAFVVSSKSPIAWIDLGPKEPIAAAIDRWRQRYSVTDAAEVRRLAWDPLEKKVAGATTVLVSPDGPLTRFPMAALPGKKQGSYLIEEMAIATIPIPRLLPVVVSGDQPSAEPSLLTVGDVNFQVALGAKPASELLAMSAPLKRGSDRKTYSSLPATRTEIAAIGDTFAKSFPQGKRQTLSQDQATKHAVCESMRSFRYLHVATHGFFAPPEVQSALDGGKESDHKEQDVTERFAARDIIGYHPDLLSGLAFAGANQQAEPGQDDGILTALAVAQLDLSKVQLATLSACETGLGTSAGGEGLLGLQRAFQLAGAKTTVASLWQVDDAATCAMMTEFYQNLWQKKLSRIESLRQAQLRMIRNFDPKTKQLRGFGKPAPIDDEKEADARQTQILKGLTPKYWAAFVLSGDWR